MEGIIGISPTLPSNGVGDAVPGGPSLRIVVDTNVWLDLLVFGDPAVARLQSLLGKAVRPIACPAMRAELQGVIQRPRFALDPPARDAILARFDALVLATAPPPDCRLACTDPDDRQFIDLAAAERASWLLSRDRALLRLRKPALARFDVRVGRVADFYNWLDGPRC